MIISETKDIGKITRFLRDPEIYERISDDGSVSAEEFNPDRPQKGIIYLEDDDNTGIIFLHWKNSITLECHIHVLKDQRHKAFEFGKVAIRWTWENTDAQKITAVIPEIYPDVIKYSIKQGLSVEGFSGKAYQKNGVLCGVYYLGISR